MLNDLAPTTDEAEVIIGAAKLDFYWLIYNMMISFSNSPIFLVLADVKVCFRFPRIHPELSRAFGLLISNLFCVTEAMVSSKSCSDHA